MVGPAPLSHAPTIDELPAAPSGKVGWPWTIGTPTLPPVSRATAESLPRVTVVTPSFNHARFLEETIRSVLLQGYPNLEYIVVDGASTDDTVDIIKRYEPWLANWVSERDSGQSDAINKGWRRATGSIVAYLNSDDVYQPGAVQAAVAALTQDPTVGLVHGDSYFIDERGGRLRRHRGRDLTVRQLFRWQGYISQPTVFLRRAVLDSIGLLNECLHYAMDFELWLRIGAHYPLKHLPQVLACERHHAAAKTALSPEKGLASQVLAAEGVFATPLPSEVWALRSEVIATHHLNLARFLLGKLGRSEEVKAHAQDALKMAPPWPLQAKAWALRLLAAPLATPLGTWLRLIKNKLVERRHRRSLVDE